MGKVGSLGVIRLHLENREAKLNQEKEKFATVHLNSVVKQHKNTEISQRF